MPFLCMSKNQDNLSCLNYDLIPNWRIDDYGLKHLRVVMAAATLLVQFAKTAQVQTVYYAAHKTDWGVLGNVLVDSLRKKYRLIWRIRTKVVSLLHFILHVVKIRKLYDITKPWLEKVGALI